MSAVAALACRIMCLWTLASHSLASADSSVSGATGGSQDVRVTVSVSQHLVTLSCEVTGPGAGSDDHKVQFFCPLLPGGNVQCFGDCSPICTMQSDGSCRVMEPLLAGGAVACDKSVSPPDRKRVSLTIDTRQARLAGPWRCKFRGTSSATVTLAAAAAAAAAGAGPSASTALPKPPGVGPVFTAGPPATASPDDPYRYGLGVWSSRGLDTGGRRPADTGDPGNQGFGRDRPALARFVRTDYVIGVLTIMSVSLLLNLGFCIRCILARHYVESRKRSQRKPLDWLGSCLCVSTVQVSLEGGDADDGDRRQSRRQRSYRKVDGDDSGAYGDRHRMMAASLGARGGVSGGGGCRHCERLDCRVLAEEEEEGPPECGCGGCGGGGGGSVRLPAFFEDRPEEEEEEAVMALCAAAVGAGSGCGQSQAGSGDSECSVGGPTAGSRLELSRRMLRRADSLLREANSLLLETDSATDQQAEQ